MKIRVEMVVDVPDHLDYELKYMVLFGMEGEYITLPLKYYGTKNQVTKLKVEKVYKVGGDV